MSARRLQALLAVTALVVVVGLALPGVMAALGRVPSALTGIRLREAPSPEVTPVTDRPAPGGAPETSVAPRPPATTVPGQLYVISDSVVLGAEEALTHQLPGWGITVEGRPALSLAAASAEVQARTTPVGPVVVVALGYHSLWERNRRNYDHWAARFDGDVDTLIAALRAQGAQRIVWVTLRELDPAIVPGGWKGQLGRYGYFFPYVNERLRAALARNADLSLADWSGVSHRPGLTVDAIHLNDQGAALMASVISGAVGGGATGTRAPA